ncbi:ParA family protein [Weissella confusa]|uniref:ParA family protein n=1 Tax=Weissella confusa TaxID=1583 RepID=UPI001C6F6FE0|nr:ParA family protein [Weissella confusa]QYU56821.1 ParA family protein [Weissella confusa]
MKIVTFLAEKGGVGKTTMAYEFGEYLAKEKQHNVLLIDVDQQLSLSETYGLVDQQQHSSVNMFRNMDVKIHHMSDNLDLIPGSFLLESLDVELMQQDNHLHTLNFWLEDFDSIHNWEQYDYIIFDTHPDFKAVNRAVVMASDVIMMPIEPERFGISARTKLENRIALFKENNRNPLNRNESLVTAELLFFNNKINKRRIHSQKLLADTADDPKVVANVPEREIFKHSIDQSVSLVDMAHGKLKDPRMTDLFIQVFGAFDKMQAAIDRTNA